MHDNEQSVLVFMRRAAAAAPDVVVACNFTPVPRYGYRVGVPLPGYYRERVNTDAALYGGGNIGNGGGVAADEVGWHGRPHSLSLTLPPLATVILEHHPN
jgi:1,4-alpha-glucan branching enzyme